MKAKKLIASVLACLVLMMGMTVLASAEGTTVATIGETPYATLEAAVAAANDGDVITLVSAANPAAAAIVVDDNITIDLNGQTLTLLQVPNNYAIVVKDTLTIEDGVGTGKLVSAADNVIGLTTSCTGGLNITGGNFESTHEYGYLIGAYNGEVNITGGSFKAAYNIVNCFDGYSAKANIEAGDFVVTGTDYWADPFLGTGIAVSGGTYSEAIPAKYLAEGTMTVKDAEGNYVLATGVAAKASVDGAEYATFEEAWANLDVYSTITLLDDVTLTEKLVVDKYIGVEGNGYTITTSAQKLFEVFANFEVYDLNMVSTSPIGRCVDTRVAGIEVNIEGCTMTALAGNEGTQPITISGSEKGGLTVNITDTTINAEYVGIIVFVPADVTIKDSSITGWSAIYTKAGSAGAEFNVVNSDLKSVSDKSGKAQGFGVIALEENDVTVSVDADSTITVDAKGTAIQAAVSFYNDSYSGNVTIDAPVVLKGDAAVVVRKLGNSAALTVTNEDVIAAIKAQGYEVADNGLVSVPEIRWITDTDAGFYMDAETKYGMMRFLFSVDLEGEIEETGIKFIKVDDKNAAGVTVGGGNAAAFYGDVYGIPESEAGNTYYAVAYVTTAAGTEWSDVVACTVDMTSQQFTEYVAGGAQ